jgi:hypothetical protein
VSVVLTGVVVLWTALGYLAIIEVVPSCGRSQLRYRLWGLRDDLVDAIRAGEFKDSELARELVSEIEVLIRGVHEVTIFRMLALVMLSGGKHLRADIESEEAAWKEKLDRLTPADKKKIKRFDTDFRGEVIWHALTRTPSGWIVTALLSPILLIRALMDIQRTRRRAKRKNRSLYGILIESAKVHAADSIGIDASLAYIRERVRDDQPLSACVH